MLLIVDRLVNETNKLLQDNESFNVIELTATARTQLAEDGYQPSMGARPLKRVFEEQIKKPLSKKILFEDLQKSTITIGYDEEYTFDVVANEAE
jgi:ATP-dependent Clp protease ATP-binding subunit ClpA